MPSIHRLAIMAVLMVFLTPSISRAGGMDLVPPQRQPATSCFACGRQQSVLASTDDQAAGSTPPTTDSRPGAFRRVLKTRSPGIAYLDTTLIGAVYGLVDWAGLHHLDHTVNQDTSGIWSIARPSRFPPALIAGTALAAIWEGGQNRLGRTLWQSLDSAALAGLSTYTLKYTFGRERPAQTTNPDRWFQGSHAQSFPSGDVSAVTALVTPMIIEYRHTDPAVYLLALVPAFDMVARVKAHGHWQTDVVGGCLVGALSGYYAHRFDKPLILSIMPHGFEVGLRKRF